MPTLKLDPAAPRTIEAWGTPFRDTFSSTTRFFANRCPPDSVLAHISDVAFSPIFRRNRPGVCRLPGSNSIESAVGTVLYGFVVFCRRSISAADSSFDLIRVRRPFLGPPRMRRKHVAPGFSLGFASQPNHKGREHGQNPWFESKDLQRSLAVPRRSIFGLTHPTLKRGATRCARSATESQVSPASHTQQNSERLGVYVARLSQSLIAWLLSTSAGCLSHFS